MPRTRRILALAATATALVMLSACASSTATGDAGNADDSTITVSSAYGDVEIPQNAERVAAVSYDTPWQLMSVDVQPIATIDYSNWLDSYTEKQQDFIADAAVIGAFGEVNFEALTAATPDLIIGDAYEIDKATFERLSSIAPTVIVGGEDRGDWQSITEQVAQATGQTTVWEEGKATYEALRDQTIATYADVIKGNGWINFSLGNEAGQFSVQLPSGTTGNLIVTELGMAYPKGAQLEDVGGSGYISLPLERLPEVFDGVTYALTFSQVDGSTDEGIQAIIDSDLFQSLEVAKSDRIYGMRTTVTDYRTAADWINELTEHVLAPLSE